MDEYRIRITRQARDHLREIRRYIEYELLAPIAAKNTIAAIKTKMQSLTHMPSRIHLTPEQPWHDQGVRRDRVKNYYIYFWIDDAFFMAFGREKGESKKPSISERDLFKALSCFSVLLR